MCAHLGLKPQSVHKIGGFKVQGREEQAAHRMIDDARALEGAGADVVLLECVPTQLGIRRCSDALDVPVIGIGAGPDVDGQILVLYDILGITQGRMPRFVQNFMRGRDYPCSRRCARTCTPSRRALSRPEHTFSLDVAAATRRERRPRRAACARADGRRGARGRLRVARGGRMRRVRADDGQSARGPLESRAARRRAECDRVVASIFVNPTQFGPSEDFAAYPRTLADDTARLDSAGTVDLLFVPDVPRSTRSVSSTPCACRCRCLAGELDGASRPGHFDGVASVVCRLLNIVAPDVLVLGQKDYQQVILMQRMIADLHMPVLLRMAPTQREPDGLAMSSRNRYLDAEQRSRAPTLHAALARVRDAVRGGDTNFAELAATARKDLERAGFKPDYVEVRRAADLAAPDAADGTEARVVIGAAWLGRARLIDNLLV